MTVPQPQPTGPYDPAADAQEHKVHAVLAYIGILVLVPLLGAKDSRFARFHANQGLVLLIIEAVLLIGNTIVAAAATAGALAVASSGSAVGFGAAGLVGLLLLLIGLGVLVLAIIGIVNAAQGQTKPLPIIGKITLLK